MHPGDAVLQAQFPVHAAPRFSPFVPMEEVGDRFVLTSWGLALEIRRKWIHAVTPVHAGRLLRPIPFGDGPQPGVRLLCGTPPRSLEKRFIEQAREALPDEHAAWISWNEHTGQFRYRPVRIQSSSPSSITYDIPEVEEGEHLVVDMHSHGLLAAGFSPQDERDDHGALKVAVCYGNLDQEVPTTAAVVRCLGVSFPIEAMNIKGQANDA